MQIPPLNDHDLKELLLRQPIVAKIASKSSTGDIRITPIWFGDEDGSLLMNTFEDSGLVKNIKRDPRCSVIIDSTEWPYYGVHYWGEAAVEGPENDPDAMGRLFAKHFEGDQEKAKEYSRQLIGWGKRVFVRFRPRRSTTWDFRPQ